MEETPIVPQKTPAEQPQALTTDQARQAIQEDKINREKAVMTEFLDSLKRHNCEYDITVTLNPRINTMNGTLNILAR
jgi:hypothetical protein